MANSLSSALRDLAPDERVEQGRLAGVRVADDADGRRTAADRGRGPRSGAAGGRARPAPSSSRSASRMIRRSVSSWLSPGPREPMPPCVRDRWVQSFVRRGSWYSSWASSTWSRPSWVWACWAKMSRISRLRSITLTLSRLSSAFCWLGRQLVVGDEQRRSRSPLLACDELLGLALADVPVGIDVATVLPLGADHLGAGRRREVGQLGQRLLGRPAGVVAGVDGDAGTPARRAA